MKFAFIAAAAATLALTVPAAAQVSIDVGPGGVRAGVGERPYYRDGRRWDSRAQYRRDREVVVIKKQRPYREYDRRRGNRTVIIER